MSKQIFIVLLLGVVFQSNAQKDGQSFCGGDDDASYFELMNATKYIVWSNTYYIEKREGEKEINGKTYIEYTQTWESGDKNSVYLREENGAVYQYEENHPEDSLRLPKETSVGTQWTTADGLVTYEILSTDESLKTPVCNYKGLLVMKGDFKNGSFLFYYLKGFGYVGATQGSTLISFNTPDLPKRKKN